MLDLQDNSRNIYKVMSGVYRVLFVCTGNICRSPTADAFLRHKIQQEELESHIEVDSAGTHGYHVGDAPDPRSVDVLKAKGIDMSYLRARKFMPDDFKEFDLILAMDKGHYAHMNRLRPPNAKAELVCFMSYAGGNGEEEVPDPYYGGHEGFLKVLDMIDAGTDGLLDDIRAKIGQ